MVRRGLLDSAVPRLKQYMAEEGGILTSKEVKEFLGVSDAAAYNVLSYMEAIEIIDHVKRGRRNLYYLKGKYDENLLAEILSRVQVSRRPKRSNRPIRTEMAPVDLSRKETLEEHTQSLPKDMLPALAVIGLYQTESNEPQTRNLELKPVEASEKKVGTPLFITVRLHGRVKSLPREARLLSKSDTTYLKERYLRGLDGYEDIERFDCFFSEAPALERGEYGNVFYVSMGTNPWAKLYKVTVKRRAKVNA